MVDHNMILNCFSTENEPENISFWVFLGLFTVFLTILYYSVIELGLGF